MKEATKCEVCSENSSKYKCPKCLTKYCSVLCYKTHCSNPEQCQSKTKENPSEIKQIENRENSTPNEPILEESEISDDQVLPDQLEKIESCRELKDLLDNKHLRDMLVHVNNSNQISKDIEKAMQEPIFCEFASKCLEVVKNKESSSIGAPNLKLDEELNERNCLTLPI